MEKSGNMMGMICFLERTDEKTGGWSVASPTSKLDQINKRIIQTYNYISNLLPTVECGFFSKQPKALSSHWCTLNDMNECSVVFTLPLNHITQFTSWMTWMTAATCSLLLTVQLVLLDQSNHRWLISPACSVPVVKVSFATTSLNILWFIKWCLYFCHTNCCANACFGALYIL